MNEEGYIRCVRTGTLQLVDGRGNIRAVLDADSEGEANSWVALLLNDGEDNLRLSIGLSLLGPEISVNDGQGDEATIVLTPEVLRRLATLTASDSD